MPLPGPSRGPFVVGGGIGSDPAMKFIPDSMEPGNLDRHFAVIHPAHPDSFVGTDWPRSGSGRVLQQRSCHCRSCNAELG
jgi:hypothetical protein